MNPTPKIIAFVAALALAGCTREVSHTPATPEALSDALLTITDMGSGWEETQRQVFDERSNENPSLDESVFCAAASTLAAPLPGMAGGSGADVEMFLNDVESGARYMRLQAWTSGDVMSYVGAVSAAIGECDGVTETDDAGVTATTALITGRTVGDESVSWSTQTIPPAGTEDQKYESISRTTVARFNDIVMVLQFGDANVVGSTTALDEDEWWAVVIDAGDKLDELAR